MTKVDGNTRIVCFTYAGWCLISVSPETSEASITLDFARDQEVPSSTAILQGKI